MKFGNEIDCLWGGHLKLGILKLNKFQIKNYFTEKMPTTLEGADRYPIFLSVLYTYFPLFSLQSGMFSKSCPIQVVLELDQDLCNWLQIKKKPPWSLPTPYPCYNFFYLHIIFAESAIFLL